MRGGGPDLFVMTLKKGMKGTTNEAGKKLTEFRIRGMTYITVVNVMMGP